MAPKNKSAAESMSQEELEKALYVPPPTDAQVLEEHVRQLLMRAQVSWLSKRDVLDILTNWREYSLPISLMPPDQPGRAFPVGTAPCSRRVVRVQRVGARTSMVCDRSNSYSAIRKCLGSKPVPRLHLCLLGRLSQ